VRDKRINLGRGSESMVSVSPAHKEEKKFSLLLGLCNSPPIGAKKYHLIQA
jgi:hypothetical protein